MTRSTEWSRPRLAAMWRSQPLRLSLASVILSAAVFVGSTPTVGWAAGVVGAGTADSCTDAAFNVALAGGGLVTFNCGSTPVTIDISTGTGTKTISADTTIDGRGLITIGGGNSVGVFSVNAGVTFTIQNLTIVNGYSMSAGGGVFNAGDLTVTNSTFSANTAGAGDFGGGIYNAGTLTVTNSTFSYNSASGGGGIFNAGELTVTNSIFSGNGAVFGGGGIDNGGGGTLTVTDSTFSGNNGNGLPGMGGFGGGGINNFGTLTVTNSTFAANSAAAGGGIGNAGGTLTVANSTFSGNSASNGGFGGGLYNAGPLTVTNSTFSGNSAAAGGGIDNAYSGHVTVANTIVANSTGGGDCASHSATLNGGHNLIGDAASACGMSNGVNGNIVGIAPLLGTLGNNGGRTQTVALLPGSPAVHAGDAAVCAAVPVSGVDQRGVARPGVGSTTCSIGAYEFYQTTVGTGTPASCTEASLDVMLGVGGLVTFDCGNGPVTVTVSGTKTIKRDTTIDGGGLITISGGNSVGVFSVNADVKFTVENLTIANGNSAIFGGGIYNNRGTLRVTNSTFAGNRASGVGDSYAGGIFNGGGTLVVANSTFSGNSASTVGAYHLAIGGGIVNEGGTLTVTNSTFSGNSGEGGGIFTLSQATVTVANSTFSSNSGGGIASVGTLLVTNSTFSGNSAIAGGGIAVSGGTLLATNSTLSGNSAEQGGAIYGDNGALTLTNTIVANSTLGGNCAGSVTDGGHNLDSDGTCGVGPATDPMLDSAGLADNHGPTQTIALQAGSPAINAGDESVCAGPLVNNLDQRGYKRPGTGATNCCIGAYEYHSPGPAPSCAGDCNHNGAVTINELITLVNMALGSVDMSACAAGNWNGDAEISVDEILRAVNAGLTSCPVGPYVPDVTIGTYPAIDGSTSTLPLARLIACELLGLPYRWQPGMGPEGEAEIVPVAATPAQAALAEQVLERIVFNKTHQAYLNLVDGVADLITVANPPSPEERAYADARGITLVWEPLALDALVIVLNASNPIRGLTTAQIQGIYMGELTDWSAVGGAASEIHPYVRPENSGSQQLFNAIVMQGLPMPVWPPDRQIVGMGGLIDKIRTDELAIGYSVYYWVTSQYPSAGYSIIAVDGIAPAADTIGARSYPFTAEVWIVTRADLDKGTLAHQLHDWMLSPDGQQAVGRSGYVPIIR